MTEEFPVDPELDQVFLDTVMNDLRERGEDWSLVISPLPDKLGWRAAMMIGDGMIVAGVAGDPIATRAGVTAIGRGLANLEELTEGHDREDEQLT